MNWHLALGWISSALFVLTLWGSVHQITIFVGYLRSGTNEKFANLTLSYFFAYFFSVFLFFSYAAFLTPPDFFIFTTRGLASLLAIGTLFLVWQGTNGLKFKAAFLFCAILFSVVICIYASGIVIPQELFHSTKFLIVCVMLYVIYSYIVQIRKITQSKSSEGISKLMNFTVVLKDIGTVLYAFTFDLNDSWPLIMQGAMNGIFRLILLSFCLTYSKKEMQRIPAVS